MILWSVDGCPLRGRQTPAGRRRRPRRRLPGCGCGLVRALLRRPAGPAAGQDACP